MTRYRRPRRLFPPVALVLLVPLAAAGCASLQKGLNTVDPANADKPLTQVGNVLSQAANNPLAHGAASAVPYGNTVLYVVGAIGGLLGVLGADQARRHAKDHKELARRKAAEKASLPAA